MWLFDNFLLENRSDHEETRKIWSRILENADALQEQKGLRPRWMQTYQRSEKIPSVSLSTLQIRMNVSSDEGVHFLCCRSALFIQRLDLRDWQRLKDKAGPSC